MVITIGSAWDYPPHYNIIVLKLLYIDVYKSGDRDTGGYLEQ